MWYRSPSQRARRFRSTARLHSFHGTRLAGVPLQSKQRTKCLSNNNFTSTLSAKLEDVGRAPHFPKHASPQSTPSNVQAQRLQPSPTLAAECVSHRYPKSFPVTETSPDLEIPSLLKQGSPGEAAQLALRMLSKRIPISPETLDNVVRRLLDPEELSCPVVGPANSTALAIRLLQYAQRVNSARKKETYQVVIEKCVANGALREATSLLVGLTQEWDLNRLKQDQFSPQPSMNMLRPIVESLQDELSKSIRNSQASDNWTEVREALAKLVGLANSRLLPSSRVSSFVKACHTARRYLQVMQSRSDGITVSITSRDERVDAQIHGYLQMFIRDLCPSKTGLQPPHLDLNTCNALLHYALRFCHSQNLAGTVLRYMFEVRAPAFPTEQSTYNILLRSSSLLRENDFAELVMRVWNGQSKKENLHVAIQKEEVWNGKRRSHKPPPQQSDHRERRMDNESFLPPPPITPNSWVSSPERARSHGTSLVACITHSTSIGRPEEVVRFIYQLFPGIDFSRLAPRSSTSLERSVPHDYFTSVQAASRLGPYVISAILNAAAKTGKIGLVERLWHLVNQAEVASWDDSPGNSFPSWRLSIHSFTSVLRAYASEKRRGSPSSSFSSVERRARGWGGDLKGMPTPQLAEIMAERVYSSREYCGPRKLHTPAGVKLVEMPDKLSDPVPDKRFFLAALDAFDEPSSNPGRSPRNPLGNRRAREYLRWSRKIFLKQGYSRQRPTALMGRVLLDMRRCNQEIPARYLPLVMNHTAQVSY
jgi:hypothetical protein